MSYADALMKPTAALSMATVLVFASLTMPPNANAAKTPVAGAKCLKINSKVEFKGKLFTCVKVKGKTVWNKGVLIKPATPKPSSSISPSPTPTPTPSVTVSSTPTPTPTPTPPQVLYTLERVRANNSSSSCWTIIDGFVYDLTSWISAHPGGPGVIRSMCGTDGTNAFKAQHQNQMSPAQRLNSYLLGPLSR